MHLPGTPHAPGHKLPSRSSPRAEPAPVDPQRLHLERLERSRAVRIGGPRMVCMEVVWNLYGIHMEFRNLYGIYDMHPGEFWMFGNVWKMRRVPSCSVKPK